MSNYSYKSKRAKVEVIGDKKWYVKKSEEFKTQDKHSGFQAKVYKNGNTIIVAFEGTDKTDPGDLVNDVGIAIPLLKKALDSSNLKESKLYRSQA